MEAEQRKLTIVTSLKKYSGYVDVPGPDFRTTDLLNMPNIFLKNPDEKCYDDAILMRNAKLHVEDSFVYKKFDNIQIRLPEIVFFYDNIQELSNETEKKRALAMDQQTQKITIITRVVGGSFYDITGTFHGLFRKKSKDSFIPLVNAKVTEIHNRSGKWAKRDVSLPYNFICVNNQNIESVTIG